MDGVVRSGATHINQAPITGESVPVVKTPGAEVYAGSINGEGVLEVTVTHRAGDTTISRMIRLVQEAQDRRAPVQRMIDRFAGWYTPAVVAIAALAAIIPPLLFGQPFWNPSPDETGWLALPQPDAAGDCVPLCTRHQHAGECGQRVERCSARWCVDQRRSGAGDTWSRACRCLR